MPDWEGLYRVRYWDPEWQDLLSGAPDSWVDQVAAAGFDGVVLDPSGTWEFFEEQGWASARGDMVALISDLAGKARRGAGGPDFGVFAWSPGELVNDAQFLRAVTGVVQDGTWFGAEEPGVASPTPETEAKEAAGRLLRQAGAVVLNLDYTEKPDQVRQAWQRARAAGFVEYAAPLELDRLQWLPNLQPEGPQGPSGERARP